MCGGGGKTFLIIYSMNSLKPNLIRIETLENALKQKCNELNQEKIKTKNLREDFKYNLKLLEERDAELEGFEQTVIGGLNFFNSLRHTFNLSSL